MSLFANFVVEYAAYFVVEYEAYFVVEYEAYQHTDFIRLTTYKV